jgi:pimeloyl-ACP methyl ester carboxylesterase
MEQVTSADGTRIAFERSGNGPPLIVVVGAFCDRASSRSLAALLASSYTVYEYDRRGRGDSDDTTPYSIQREVEDLDAVASAAGGPPFVYGHSSGGALALEAAAHGVEMRKIAVYEPPYTGDKDAGPEFSEQLDELVGEGRRDEAAERFLTLTGAPPEVIAHIKASPGWPRMQALAHTLSRDRNLGNGGAVPVERFDRIKVPILAMAGGASHDWAREAVETIARALPNAQAHVVEGQPHAPADDVVTPVLEAFLA